MATPQPRATLKYQTGGIEQVLQFLKRTRSELRELRMVRVWQDRLQVFDVNQDFFEIQGLGYQDTEVVTALDVVAAAYKREQIHEEVQQEYKEFKTGRRYPWAADRVM
ncbi:MAG: hypothetical protein GTO76_11360 [Planctomycetales bacterium]|nr:hypothetical protein [Planctomycetales bacterium]NIN09225.1 hypothetical protein [Planctomycetales bacterium]NIN78325.1 hypothetical protein [Planctomycetales bacterium]NIO35504.1 hypothetical protein [Planctomycetales bacterium]NIO47274.1 hypothetical protein [Planctomycetales bacterium]